MAVRSNPITAQGLTRTGLGSYVPRSSPLDVLFRKATRRTLDAAGGLSPCPPGAVRLVLGSTLEGVNRDLFESAHATVRVPFVGARHKLKTLNAKLKLNVEQDTEMRVDVRVERTGDALSVRSAKVVFTKPLIIKNPAAALKPSGGPLGGFLDWAKDSAADARIDGMHLDDQGNVVLDGLVRTPFFMKDLPLSSQVSPDSFPRIPLELPGSLSPAVKPDRQPLSAEQALEAIAATTNAGTFEVTARTRPVPVQIAGSSFDIDAGTGPITVTASGPFDLRDDHTFTATSTTTCSSPGLQVSAASTIEGDIDAMGGIAADIDTNATVGLGDVRGELRVVEGFTVPFQVGGAHQILALQAKAHRSRAGKLTMREPANAKWVGANNS